MAVYDRERILNELEADIAAKQPDTLTPMPGDKWLLSSCWQKAVRQGDVEIAQRAASALWRQDRQSLYRRLHIVALEDIGVGDLCTMVKVLTATASAIWRRRVGDERVALHLTQLMCGAVKNRMSDELFSQAERASEYGSLRQELSKAGDALLIEQAAHEGSPLIERALALWYLAGTKKFPSDVMPGRVGNPVKAVEVLRGLNAPTDLVESCISVMGRTSWPLSIFMPLIWQEVQKHKPELYVRSAVIPKVPDVEGIPVYAGDLFTRVGQGSIRQFQRAVPELRGYSVRQVGLALFYTEGCKIDKALTCDSLEEFRKAGEVADIEGAGLCLPEYLGMKESLIQNIETLHGIRCDQLQRYLNGAGA